MTIRIAKELQDKFEKWIYDLKNTDKKQIIATCKNNEGYCAFGIGLLSYGYKFDNNNDLSLDGNKGFSYDNLLQDNFREFDKGVSLWSRVTDLNDNLKKSFKEIAEILEKDVEFV